MLTPSLEFKEHMAEARRSQILMAAARVFAEKGYHKATTKEIAQTAGISEGTIYNYFTNKRELLLALIELIAAQPLKNLITARSPADPKAFITMILRDRYQLAQERGYLLAPIMAEMLTDAGLRQEIYRKIALPITALLEQYIQAQIDSGLFRPVNPVIVTRAFVGAMVVNFAMKLANFDPKYENVSADTLIETLASLFVGMLLNPERAGET